ncbi:MAG: DUF6364 family protein [Balneola sp.]
MPDKLTLRLEKRLINRAKKHAKEQGTSVSKMVANYFEALESSEKEHFEESLPPITKSLVGVLEETPSSEQDYRTFLEEKHS